MWTWEEGGTTLFQSWAAEIKEEEKAEEVDWRPRFLMERRG